MTSTGESTNDFSQIISDFGRVVSYKIVTKSTDPITGTEISSFGSANNQTVIFFVEANRYIWDKSGLLAVGDAYILAPASLGISRYDQFSINGETYYIESVIKRYVMTTAMCDAATCFRVT